LNKKIALAHIADSRDDLYKIRESLVLKELQNIQWIKDEFKVIESKVLRSDRQIKEFITEIKKDDVSALILHIPIWADPIFSVKLAKMCERPILLVGNTHLDTSSLVGMLGAGGALDQIGIYHLRIFEAVSQENKKKISAFLNSANTIRQLHGKTLGLFGGKSLGIFTAVADPAQWQTLFGVDIEYIDQCEIVNEAKSISDKKMKNHYNWLIEHVGKVEFGGKFTKTRLTMQIKSYLATKKLINKYGLDFVGVKCQTELSDGYVSQCVAHMLLNGELDAEGPKTSIVHACESDADGALTMEILHLLSGEKPTALLDIRWFDQKKKQWTFTNCGAMPADFYSCKSEEDGLSKVHVRPHVFGEGGGCALTAFVSPRIVTLARLCRISGDYQMFVVKGEVIESDPETLKNTTAAFPQAIIKANAGYDFLQKFGSNHIHMVSGDYIKSLTYFCDLLSLPCQVWE